MECEDAIDVWLREQGFRPASPELVAASREAQARIDGLEPDLSRRVAYSADEYARMSALLDEITDKVGEDESHPLAPLMGVLGALVQAHEDREVAPL